MSNTAVAPLTIANLAKLERNLVGGTRRKRRESSSQRLSKPQSMVDGSEMEDSPANERQSKRSTEGNGYTTITISAILRLRSGIL